MREGLLLRHHGERVHVRVMRFLWCARRSLAKTYFMYDSRALQYNKKFSYGHKVQGFSWIKHGSLLGKSGERARERAESAVDGSRVMARLRTPPAPLHMVLFAARERGRLRRPYYYYDYYIYPPPPHYHHHMVKSSCAPFMRHQKKLPPLPTHPAPPIECNNKTLSGALQLLWCWMRSTKSFY